uniref:Uncharacterized protein n=1 Tax=Nelumbo nucifera TaxID=4432 RepID=A0A822ZND1_NELNU|nr:TPA_asm: hypothetical protein HUJ06_002676 [Nelumbo nucifera]
MLLQHIILLDVALVHPKVLGISILKPTLLPRTSRHNLIHSHNDVSVYPCCSDAGALQAAYDGKISTSKLYRCILLYKNSWEGVW